MNPLKQTVIFIFLLAPATQGFSQMRFTDHLQIGFDLNPFYSNSKVTANAGGKTIKEERDTYEKFKIGCQWGVSVAYVVNKNLKLTGHIYYTNPGERDIRNVTNSDSSVTSIRRNRSYIYFGGMGTIDYTITPPWKRDWLARVSVGLCGEKYYDARERVRTQNEGGGSTVSKEKINMTLRGGLQSLAVAGYMGFGYERSLPGTKVQLCIQPYYKFYLTSVFVANNGATNSKFTNLGVNLSVAYRISHKVIH
ncbi:MAG: hypothetical protein K1X81_02260 [Bacteroidia bacterium]|nr:hypothetical protein [Bacteroidia bacterium]